MLLYYYSSKIAVGNKARATSTAQSVGSKGVTKMINRNNTEVYFEVMEHIGTLEEMKDGWNKEVNIVSWNGGAPKIDIRDWDESHERMTRGITLFEETAEKLAEAFEDYKNRPFDFEGFEPKELTSTEVTFEILDHIGVIETTRSNGWTKECNIVSWNGGPAKFDIRDWNPEHDRMGRGITLKEEQGKRLAELLNKRYK